MEENERSSPTNDELPPSEVPLMGSTTPVKQNGFPFRYVIAFTACFGMIITNAMSVCLGQAIVAMVNKTSDVIHGNNSECNYTDDYQQFTFDSDNQVQHGEFDWNGFDQGILLGSVYWGAIISPIPGSWLANKFGGKIIFQLGIGLAGLATILFPITARFDFYVLMALRITTGFFIGAVTPATTTILANWTPLPEKNFLFILVLFGGQISMIVTYLLTGYLCQHGFAGGWPSVFYIFGIIAIVFSLSCIILLSDTPASHRWISREEKMYIKTNCLFDQRNQPTIPWKKILTSVPVWALMTSNVFFAWGFFLMLTEIPTYIADILHYPIQDTSMFMAAPFVITMVISLTSSKVADYLLTKKLISVTALRKSAVSIAHLSAAVLVLFVPTMGCNRLGCVCLLITMMGITAFNAVGTEMNFTDLMPQIAGTMYAVATVPPQISGIASPYLVGLFIQRESTMAQWNKIFYITSASYVTGVLIFVCFASGKQQVWNRN